MAVPSDRNRANLRIVTKSRHEQRVRVLGHRGARTVAPENTVEAFRAALAEGADGVELDVRRSADGELVCLHDADLERTTDATGPACARSLVELKALDAGARFEAGDELPFRGCGVRIPTLAEALDAVPPPKLVDIEVKLRGHGTGSPARLSAEVGAFLADRPDLDRIMVSSLSRRLATLLASTLDPPVKVALVTHSVIPLGMAARMAETAGCECLFAQAAAYFTPGARSAAERALEAGITLGAWTVEEPAVVRRLEGLGVTVLISDQPGQVRQALDD
jgi:glycerophosphoryl diester phosphodiesterase